MDAGVLFGTVFGGVAAVAAAVSVWLVIHYRNRDRRDRIRADIEKLVRDCESYRVLWSPYADEESERSYGAVQSLRQVLRNTRGQLSAETLGATELDKMKVAAEAFCTKYERRLDTRRPRLVRREVDFGYLRQIIADLRVDFVPALERIRKLYGIPAGHRDIRGGGFSGMPIQYNIPRKSPEDKRP